MNYKISTYVLAIVLIATVFYFKNQPTETKKFKDYKGNFIEYTQETQDEVNAFNEIMDVDEEVILEWKNKEIDSINTGKALKISEAYTKLKDFSEWNNKLGNGIKQISPYGFAFGTQTIRNLLKAINKENRKMHQANNTTNLIYGIRINLSHTIGPKGVPYLDALIVPIKKNGYNYIKITKADSVSLVTNDLLLNTSWPCPDNCSQ